MAPVGVILAQGVTCDPRADTSSLMLFGASSADSTRMRTALEVDSIALHVFCRQCAEFSVVLARDGKASFVGSHLTQHQGRWSGTVGLERMSDLTSVAKCLGLASLDSAYFTSAVNDLPYAVVTIAWRGSRGLQTIKDYGYHGPAELWAFERLIEATADEIEWRQP
jgi:hypothetical protein